MAHWTYHAETFSEEEHGQIWFCDIFTENAFTVLKEISVVFSTVLKHLSAIKEKIAETQKSEDYFFLYE